MDSVFRFQKDQGIVQSESQSGAGYFGNKTCDALAAAVNRRIEKIEKYPSEMQVYVPAKISLPQLAELSTPKSVAPLSLRLAPILALPPFRRLCLSRLPKIFLSATLSE